MPKRKRGKGKENTEVEIQPTSKRKTAHDQPTSSHKKPQDKSERGLRHFSLLVLNKVEEKQVTTYKQVADELILELDKGDEDKNIRRRVYDALNVLLAMNIISKDEKEVQWVGLPKNSSLNIVPTSEAEKELLERVKQKKLQLRELLLQEKSFCNLLYRNSQRELSLHPDNSSRIPLPFILISSHVETKIDCEVLENRTQYRFEFDFPFEIHDDIQIVRLLESHNHIKDHNQLKLSDYFKSIDLAVEKTLPFSSDLSSFENDHEHQFEGNQNKHSELQSSPSSSSSSS